MLEWVLEYFKIVGRIPSVDEKYRSLTREKARDLLKIDGDPIITVLLGGASADSQKFLKLIERLWNVLGLEYSKSTLILITGPRISYRDRFDDKRVIIRGYVKDVGAYLKASNVVISRAGRTTVTDLEYLGIPSVIIPLNNHFEQNFIARESSSAYPYIKPIWEFNLKPLYKAIKVLLDMSPKPSSDKIFQGHKIIAYELERIMKYG
jgi:UDP:flavonoid glycosyltransferase YjiC (YdhE family)